MGQRGSGKAQLQQTASGKDQLVVQKSLFISGLNRLGTSDYLAPYNCRVYCDPLFTEENPPNHGQKRKFRDDEQYQFVS